MKLKHLALHGALGIGVAAGAYHTGVQMAQLHEQTLPTARVDKHGDGAFTVTQGQMHSGTEVRLCAAEAPDRCSSAYLPAHPGSQNFAVNLTTPFGSGLAECKAELGKDFACVLRPFRPAPPEARPLPPQKTI
ncbi:MAG: hypothetical protein PW734_10770 [Verrucomicrobium sp.]|nr:hypothetical protein [Verrucomicrobium sp.]